MNSKHNLMTQLDIIIIENSVNLNTFTESVIWQFCTVYKSNLKD